MSGDKPPLFILQASNGKVNIMDNREIPKLDRFFDPKLSGVIDRFVFYPWDYPTRLSTEGMDIQ